MKKALVVPVLLMALLLVGCSGNSQTITTDDVLITITQNKTINDVVTVTFLEPGKYVISFDGTAKTVEVESVPTTFTYDDAWNLTNLLSVSVVRVAE